MEELRAWLGPIAGGVSVATTWLLAIKGARRSEVAAQNSVIERQTQRLIELESRLAAAEMAIRHLPDKDTSHRLEMAIARLEGRMETMDERLKPVAAMASRVQERIFEESR